jgi:hypothetical protein
VKQRLQSLSVPVTANGLIIEQGLDGTERARSLRWRLQSGRETINPKLLEKKQAIRAIREIRYGFK